VSVPATAHLPDGSHSLMVCRRVRKVPLVAALTVETKHATQVHTVRVFVTLASCEHLPLLAAQPANANTRPGQSSKTAAGLAGRWQTVWRPTIGQVARYIGALFVDGVPVCCPSAGRNVQAIRVLTCHTFCCQMGWNSRSCAHGYRRLFCLPGEPRELG